MIDESLKNLIIATPVIAVLLYFLKYFIKSYEEEKKINKQEQAANKEERKQDSKIIAGVGDYIKENNRKHDETNKKIDYITKKLEK